MSERSLEDVAAELARTTCEAIRGSAKNPEILKKELDYLNTKIVDAAAALRTGDGLSAIDDETDLLWSLARYLPGYDTAALYETRMSTPSLLGAVLVGWIAGGLLSGLLSIFSLGGDVLRAAAIFAVLWGSEYMAANPATRRTALACLGMGGLARFASMAAGGFVRLANPLSWRAFFPAKLPFFKLIWFSLGAVFIVVFFSKKIVGVNIPAFEDRLRDRIARDLRLIIFVLDQIEQRDKKIRELKKPGEEEKEKIRERQGDLASAILEIRPSLNEDQRRFLDHKLTLAGVETPDDDYLIWNGAEHDALYDPIGVINDGDQAKILRPAEIWDGKISKGNVQRVG